MSPAGQTSFKIPSKEIYDALDNGGEGRRVCVLGGDPQNLGKLKQKVKDSLWMYSINDQNLVNKIANNYCHACNRTGTVEWLNSVGDADLPYFFFYWLGDKFQTRSNFSPLMKEIYNKLTEFEPTCECDNLYPNIIKDRFPQAKTLFEYYYDSNKMQNSDKLATYCISSEYKQSLIRAQTAYTTLSQQCGQTANDEYCKKFEKEKRNGKEYGPPKQLPEETCPKPASHLRSETHGAGAQNQGKKAEGAQNQGKKAEKEPPVKVPEAPKEVVPEKKVPVAPPKKPEVPPEPPAGTGVSPAALVSSEGMDSTTSTNIGIGGGTAAAVALPALAFYLYKYTSIFSDLRNTFGGGEGGRSTNGSRRKKRSLVRNLNMRNGEDNSPFGSTTVDSNSEPDLTEEEDDDSTVYSVPYIR